MKHLFILLFALLSIKAYSQVIADPAHNQVDFTNLGNSAQDAAMLPLEGIVNLRIPILNLNLSNGLPAGSCKIKIGLGSKLILDPAFNLTNTNTSAYFYWIATNDGGQVQLTGELINPLPANYAAVCLFQVKGSVQGSSTITANFLVTNHNTVVNLSDENPTNNTSSLAYTVIPVIPVTFTGITAKKEGCNINVNFSAETEINVDHYEIEASKDGLQYFKMTQLQADHRINYSGSFYLAETIRSNLIFIRVKSVDKDGRKQYTQTLSIKGSCEANLSAVLYPNPVSSKQDQVIIKAVSGLFNGKLNISLSDIAGKLIRSSDIVITNTNQFSYQTGSLAAGQYLMKIQTGSEEPIVLKFQKL